MVRFVTLADRTATKATAYNFHEGGDLRQVHFLVPVTAVSAGDPPRPSTQLASSETRTAVFTCVAATTKELEKYPNAELVDVTRQH
jgi:hypothetical protein